MIGANIYIKHENYHPGGCFKIRGGLNIMYHLHQQTNVKGIITFSTDNHGISVATAAKIYGIAATIVIKEKQGLHYIHATNEPLIINGVGTEFT